MSETLDRLQVLFDNGGDIIWAILAGSILMWSLIIERYLYFAFTLPGLRQHLIQRWLDSVTRDALSQERLRTSLSAIYRSRTRNHLFPIQTLTGILPLLGLFGTVSGMIIVFDVITLFGTGNVRGMAAGISEALITTMAGLITALSGLYFSVNLESKAQRAIDIFELQLNYD